MTAKEQLVAIGLLTGGLGCAGIGVLQARETADFVLKAESVPGKILSLNRRIGQSERIESRQKTGLFARTYFRTVVFRTRQGMPVVEQSHRGSTSSRSTFRRRYAPRDEAVVILYDPADPKDFRLDTRWGVWGTTVCFVVTGLFLLAFGTAIQIGVPVLRHLSRVALLPMRLSRKKHPTA